MAAGWHPDPYGRTDQRYWDGERWTEHVLRAGVPGVDVLDAPSTPEFGHLLDALGPDAKERPEPDLLGALSAGGAILVAAGVLLLVAGDDGNRAGLLVGSALLVAAGYFLAALVGERFRPAAVALAATGALVFIFVAFEGRIEEGKLAAPLIVVTLVTVVMYVAPVLRGRPLLLGLALVSLVGCITFLAAQGEIDRTSGRSSSGATDIGSTAVQSAYAVLLIAGVVLLAAAFLLDHAEYHGLATVCIAVAIISVLSGAAGVGSELGNAAGAILVGLAGLALAVVGHLGRRRFTTWLGALVVPYALIAIVVAIVSNDNRVGGGLLLAIFGAALVAVCGFLPSIWQARARRDGPAAPPPAATAP